MATLPDLAAMKSLGLNIVGLSDFHGDLHASDPGPVRFKDQKDYAEATRRAVPLWQPTETQVLSRELTRMGRDRVYEDSLQGAARIHAVLR